MVRIYGAISRVPGNRCQSWRKKGPAVWTAGPFLNSAEVVVRKLFGEGVVEAVAGRFKVDVLAELAGFTSTVLTVHADVFPFD